MTTNDQIFVKLDKITEDQTKSFGKVYKKIDDLREKQHACELDKDGRLIKLEARNQYRNGTKPEMKMPEKPFDAGKWLKIALVAAIALGTFIGSIIVASGWTP